MPELPEVEVLARHLRPLTSGKTIRAIEVRRSKVLSPTSPAALRKKLVGAKFSGLQRRGKYLLFELRGQGRRETFRLLGHLGMTGRMYLAAAKEPLPKHAAVILNLGLQTFIYEDTRYFGRLTLDLSTLEKLGPEPWDKSLTPENFLGKLRKSQQPIKVKLLDQSLIAGIGNIYASEALFLAGISPRKRSDGLSLLQAKKLLVCIRKVLQQAIECGSTIPLNFSAHKSDGLFYYGSEQGTADYYCERLLVYDRLGEGCVNCGSPIKRMVQAARSTFFCSRCQKG